MQYVIKWETFRILLFNFFITMTKKRIKNRSWVVISHMQERQRDSISNKEMVLKIITKHPYLTPLMIKRMQTANWTSSEILEWEMRDWIFFPSVKYSCSMDLSLQYFPLDLLVKKRYWQYSIYNFIHNHPNICSQQSNSKNNLQNNQNS